jgi:hypothetical protein
MLACEGWTLTQSSGWSAVDVELGLALALEVELALGLAAIRASTEAAEVAEGVANVNGDGGAELDWVGEAELDGEADVDDEAAGEGGAARSVGLIVELPAEAGVVGVALTDEVGSGDGVVVCVGLGVGVGVGVLVAGSTWQFGPALAEAVLREPACAMPVQAVSAPRITRPPASELSVVARRCVKRTSTNLSTLLVAVAAGLYVVRSQPGDGWGLSTHIRSPAYLCVSEYANRGGPS